MKNQVSTSTTSQQNVSCPEILLDCGSISDQQLLFDHKQACIWPLELSEHYEPGNHSKNKRLKPLRNSVNVSRAKFSGSEPVWKILSSFIDEVCTKLDFEQLFLSRLDWRPVTEESQLNAWAHAGKQIKLFMFLFLCFLVWPYNKHLINRARSVCMGESWPRSLVQTSLRSVCTGDLGQDSPIQTSRPLNKSYRTVYSFC